MKAVTVLYGQTISDIAVQELGDAGRTIEIANLNGISVTDDLAAGTVLLIPDYDSDKENYVQLFADSANKPAAADISGDNEAALEGIGYWYLENDFVIS